MKLQEIKKAQSAWKVDLKPYMYQTKAEIADWIERAKFKGFINKELEIEPADESIHLGRFLIGTDSLSINVKGKRLLPVQFKLAINFEIDRDIKLDSLVGCPYTVLQDFVLQNVTLTSLEGMPKFVGGNIRMRLNGSTLQNFEHFPEHASGVSIISVHNRSKILSIKGIASDITDFQIGCEYSNLKEIVQELPELVSLWLIDPQMDEKPGFLQVFKMKKLKGVAFGNDDDNKNDPLSQTTEIIVKHLKSPDRDMLDCQEELIQAGLKEYAKL